MHPPMGQPLMSLVDIGDLATRRTLKDPTLPGKPPCLDKGTRFLFLFGGISHAPLTVPPPRVGDLMAHHAGGIRLWEVGRQHDDPAVRPIMAAKCLARPAREEDHA